MYINAQDLLFLVGAICLLWVSGFLCWALYETARLMRRANDVVTETQDRLHDIESFVDDTVEKISSLTSYFDILSSVGGKVMGMLGHRKDREEDTEEMSPRKIKKSRLS